MPEGLRCRGAYLLAANVREGRSGGIASAWPDSVVYAAWRVWAASAVSGACTLHKLGRGQRRVELSCVGQRVCGRWLRQNLAVFEVCLQGLLGSPCFMKLCSLDKGRGISKRGVVGVSLERCWLVGASLERCRYALVLTQEETFRLLVLLGRSGSSTGCFYSPCAKEASLDRQGNLVRPGSRRWWSLRAAFLLGQVSVAPMTGIIEHCAGATRAEWLF